MRKLLLLPVFFITLQSIAQVQVGVFSGISNYMGDLTDKPYQSPRFALGFTGGYEFSERLALRAGLTFARVAGADSLSNKYYLRDRNLSFQSGITELSLRGEYTVFNLSNMRWSPYVFGGVAVFHMNPYTYDQSGNKVFLKPLSTEGQALEQYPDRKPYSLTQVALPFGGGLKYALNETVHLGLEVGLRKLFTDYLDDVSSNYADPTELLTARGPQAVDLAFRGDEVPGSLGVYPSKGDQRGSATYKDWYYFSGLHLTIRLGGEGNSFSARRGKYGCPVVPR
jgi:opacity protein-like surface antigen